ncbi:MAG TPA: cytochrome c peroxidase [Alphaproteobacteria bacterium]
MADRAGPASHRRHAWIGLALMIFANGAPAQESSLRTSDVDIPSGQEPIMPIPRPAAADPLKLALGERLFEDPRLSGDGTRACSSCHDTRTNGADGRRLGKASDGSDLPFNTSTVFNAALSFRFSWTGGFRTLEAQAEASLENPMVMGARVDEAVGRLSADADIARRFRAVYGHEPDRAAILDAIAAYERSLLTPESRFDRWLGGDATALSADERTGYQLFKSLGCIACHQGVNVGGNLFERHGIFHSLASPEPKILRVPSLRNVATTPPYFHDGSTATLSDAIRKMGVAQLDRTLSDPQVTAIAAFLNSLSGTYQGRPVGPAAR